MNCRDCKWFEESYQVNPINQQYVKCYICLCKTKKMWHKMKDKGFRYTEPSHAACKTGFEPKEK